jgi:hypothetical protein
MFFADDSLIFIKGLVLGAKVLHHVLDLYENASRQMINKEKSTAMFSPNTRERIKV